MEDSLWNSLGKDIWKYLQIDDYIWEDNHRPVTRYFDEYGIITVYEYSNGLDYDYINDSFIDDNAGNFHRLVDDSIKIPYDMAYDYDI